MKIIRFISLVALFLPFTRVFAEADLTLVTSAPTADGGQEYSITIRVLLLMTALTFLPAALMMTTSFARIVIVLSILRQAIGTPQTPSTQMIIGLALFLSFFIMSPVIDKAYQESPLTLPLEINPNG